MCDLSIGGKKENALKKNESRRCKWQNHSDVFKSTLQKNGTDWKLNSCVQTSSAVDCNPAYGEGRHGTGKGWVQAQCPGRHIFVGLFNRILLQCLWSFMLVVELYNISYPGRRKEEFFVHKKIVSFAKIFKTKFIQMFFVCLMFPFLFLWPFRSFWWKRESNSWDLK